jgi:secondary thiamine-phosphate synthase enzyme
MLPVMEAFPMETLASNATYRHTRIRIATQHPTEFIDLTRQVEALAAQADIQAGLVNIQSLHTTAAIVVNEHEPLLLDDFKALLEQSAPEQGPYRHDDPHLRAVNLLPGERPNGHAHCRALQLSPAACLNLVHGRVQLGRWQRIFLVELDGPRTREVSVLLIGVREA